MQKAEELEFVLFGALAIGVGAFVFYEVSRNLKTVNKLVDDSTKSVSDVVDTVSQITEDTTGYINEGLNSGIQADYDMIVGDWEDYIYRLGQVTDYFGSVTDNRYEIDVPQIVGERVKLHNDNKEDLQWFISIAGWLYDWDKAFYKRLVKEKDGYEHNFTVKYGGINQILTNNNVGRIFRTKWLYLGYDMKLWNNDGVQVTMKLTSDDIMNDDKWYFPEHFHYLVGKGEISAYKLRIFLSLDVDSGKQSIFNDIELLKKYKMPRLTQFYIIDRIFEKTYRVKVGGSDVDDIIKAFSFSPIEKKILTMDMRNPV